jgi:hypothetical protein
MYLASIAATTGSGELAALSQLFLVAGMGLVVVMTAAYLWYTVGSARLANRLEVARAVSKRASKTSKSSLAAGSEAGGVATLVRSEVILNEQPDGEEPIALSRGLVVVGRVGSAVGWLASVAFILFVLFWSSTPRGATSTNLA